MIILAVILLLTSVYKLFLATSCNNKADVIKFADELPFTDNAYRILIAIVTADGLLCLLCSLYLLFIIL